MHDTIWSRPLTENEREIIRNLEDAPAWLIWQWLNHVMKCYDALLASIDETAAA